MKATYTAIFCTSFAVYVLAAFALGTLSDPPELGDGQDYDSIAFNVWHHRGFGTAWNDPEFRQPYTLFPRYKPILDWHAGFAFTTYRPPAMPYLLSLVYATVGRNFAAWRILNSAIMAGAVTLGAAISAEFAGALAAMMSAMLLLANPQLIAYSQRFLTEGLATFFVALLAWTWLVMARKGWTTRRAATLGLVLGALIASRTFFVIWLPIALLLPGLRRKAACLLAALVIVGPWWVRNIVVTREFMPLGTQGAINLPAGFSPGALRFGGLWFPNDGDGQQELKAQNLDPLTFEIQLARIRSGLVTNWVRQHPIDVAHLMVLHVWQELRPRGQISDLVLLLGIVGAIFLQKLPGVRIMILFVCLNILGVALTYSAAGRFMIPVHPLLLALAGTAAAVFARRWYLRMNGSPAEAL